MTVYEKWLFPTVFDVCTNPVPIDIDSDGHLETVFIGQDGTVYCISSFGELEWTYAAEPNPMYSTPAIADLDKDNELEIIIGSNTNDKITCLDREGNSLWNFSTSSNFNAAPAVVDFDLDGNLEILIGDHNGNFYCLSYDGTQKWNYSIPNGAGDAAIGDVDGDGKLEAIIPSIVHDNRIHCINSSGQLEWNYTHTANVDWYPCIADIHNDGQDEFFILADDQYYYCRNGTDGSVIWKCLLEFDTASNPILSDLTSDGSIESLVSLSFFDSGVFARIHCINDAGGIIWNATVRDEIFGSIITADLDDNGNQELIMGSTDLLYCLNSNGEQLWNYSIAPCFSTPLVVDIDLDNIYEIILPTEDGIYCLGINGVTQSGKTNWYCEGGSIHHTRQCDLDGDYLDDLNEKTYYPTDEDDSDTDDDQLNDGMELFMGTDPIDPDTDQDGLLDGEETIIGTNPLDEDTDQDGLDDYEEVTLGTDNYITNPLSNDTDTDGIDDYEEVHLGTDGYFTDPTNNDTDGDGYTDLEEINLGFDPTDPNDHPTPTTTPTTKVGFTNDGFIGLLITTSLALTVFTLVTRRKKYFE
ncbi:MAG: FG-GAP-like repeat-containing protein [Candidatus Heimdallarchaeota archaeon]